MVHLEEKTGADLGGENIGGLARPFTAREIFPHAIEISSLDDRDSIKKLFDDPKINALVYRYGDEFPISYEASRRFASKPFGYNEEIGSHGSSEQFAGLEKMLAHHLGGNGSDADADRPFLLTPSEVGGLMVEMHRLVSLAQFLAPPAKEDLMAELTNWDAKQGTPFLRHHLDFYFRLCMIGYFPGVDGLTFPDHSHPSFKTDLLYRGADAEQLQQLGISSYKIQGPALIIFKGSIVENPLWHAGVPRSGLNPILQIRSWLKEGSTDS